MTEQFIENIRNVLATRADGRGIEYRGIWSSWGEVGAFGDKIEAALEAAGASRKGRIAFIIHNRAAHAAALTGLLAHRRAASFIYPIAAPVQMAETLRDLRPVAIIADVDDWAKVSDVAAEIGAAGIILDGIDKAPRLEGKSDVPADILDAALSFEDAAVEVLSSGTTGAPKRIPMPARILDRAALSAPGAETEGEQPVQISVWPLSGVGGLCLFAGSAATGTPLVLLDRFSVPEFVDAVKRHQPPSLGLSPTAVTMLLNGEFDPKDLSSVKGIFGGSAHLDPDIQDQFEAKFGIPIYWAMGATEFCGTIIRWTPAMRAEVGNSKRGSIGTAMPGIELRVADVDTGAILPTGETGVMEVFCPQIRPDWVRTTDLVAIDPDGYVFHKGRSDGAITRGGFKILPEKIIEVLRSHPAIADASVVGLPDARLGAVPVAAVELKNGQTTTPAELSDYVRNALAPTYVPTQIRIVDALPRTPSLKPSLRDVRALFEDAAAA
ncbi:class I adenylate-forming enzyme family protein [Sphingomonas crocodyli]|uniref:Long-chain fatty acid--CoA ligase n=1 Tax=Sphingomonas crocodyli TaxID=1979270 RepID=A0A437M6D2_9SPHN|nr:fatty acid--CoA ligase family protein [Sphingomonas crocodyli]RVT93209.1 long-chain fatty acid--CoA ligase [Sphingomonas crocodyli]